MHHFAFYLATFLALIYAAIMFGYARESSALESAMNVQRTYQIKVIHAQQANQFTQALVQRIVGESMTDPALGVLLKSNGINVTIARSPEGSKPSIVPAENPQKSLLNSPTDSN